MSHIRNLAHGFLPCILFLGMLSPAYAYSVQQGNSVYVEKTQTIDGNLYAAAANITIDGHVTGDLICAGQMVTINGTVDGDVLCASQSITVTGNVGGSFRAMASSISLGGKVARSLTAMTSSMNLSRDGSVGWDALILAASAQLNGSVGRSLLGAGASFFLNGPIGQDAVLYFDQGETGDGAGQLTLTNSARIGGRLEYTGKKDAILSEQAHINGKVIHNQPSEKKAEKGGGAAGYVAWLFISVLSALALSLVLVNVTGGPVAELADDMTAKFWPTFGWGTLWTVASPAVALVLAVTIIGMRLALLSFGTWFLFLGLAKIFAGIAIGRLLVQKYWATRKDSLNTAAIVGITLCWLVFHIPVLGWFLSVVALCWGMGGLILYLGKTYRRMKPA